MRLKEEDMDERIKEVQKWLEALPISGDITPPPAGIYSSLALDPGDRPDEGDPVLIRVNDGEFAQWVPGRYHLYDSQGQHVVSSLELVQGKKVKRVVADDDLRDTLQCSSMFYCAEDWLKQMVENVPENGWWPHSPPHISEHWQYAPVGTSGGCQVEYPGTPTQVRQGGRGGGSPSSVERASLERVHLPTPQKTLGRWTPQESDRDGDADAEADDSMPPPLLDQPVYARPAGGRGKGVAPATPQ
eukprot:Hpha_TRINITY_DN25238_c0_g1::TRINITY_DN25238_c0_g1_i1::g.110807::m.110807